MRKLTERSFLGFKFIHALIGVIFLAVLVLTENLLVFHSDAYDAAKDFAQTDQRVIGKLGEVTAISPRIFDGWELNDSMNGGTAHFTFDVRGTRSSGILSVALKSEHGRWVAGDAVLAHPDKTTEDLVPFENSQ